MADKKSSGFKTFLLLLIVLFLAFFLGCGAFLILSPNSNIFGVSYVSNKATETITRANNSLLNNGLDYYTTINIDATSENKGFCSVEINYDNATGASSVQLIKNTSGFLHGEVRTEYELTLSASGSTLNINLLEPEYNFIMLNKYSILQINMSSTTETTTNMTFNIKTNNGSITIGGAIDSKTSASTLNIKAVSAESVNGKVEIDRTAFITGNLALRTPNGAIDIESDISAKTINLEANKGKITTKKFTNSNIDAIITIKSVKSHIIIDEIAGNCVLDTNSGTVEINKIGKDFSTLTNISDCFITINEVGKNVSIANYESNIRVNIGKVFGDTSILAGGKGISIGDALGSVYIKTTSGEVYVNKNALNSESLTVETTSGIINSNINNVKNTNLFKTINGGMNINFKETTPFYLIANSPQGSVYQKYLDSNENNINSERGESTPNSANKIEAISTSGRIVFGWIA